MTWPTNIERWRSFANLECKDIPVDLVLSIIRHESGGKPGLISSRDSASATIPTDAGGQKTVDRAMGLMQVIAPNVAAWNTHKQPVITWEDMTGSDERSTRLQIRIGCSIFCSYVHRLNQFDPAIFTGTTPGTATPDQLSLAVVAYLMGPGKPGGKRGLIPRLEQIKDTGKPLTLNSLASMFPTWGWSESQQRWINRPNQYGQSVWAAYRKHSMTPLPNDANNKPRNDWIIPLGIGLIALVLLKQTGILKSLKPARL